MITLVISIFVMILFILSLLYVYVPDHTIFWYGQLLVTEYSIFFLIFSSIQLVLAFTLVPNATYAAILVLLMTFSVFQYSKPILELANWNQRLRKENPFFFDRPNFKPDWMELFVPLRKYKAKRTTFSVNTKDGASLPVDFLYAQSSNRPLVINIHGGAWRRGDRNQIDAYNQWLCSQDYNVASISYRLLPQFKWPTQFNDVKEVIGEILQRSQVFKFDTSRIFLSGRSAGGHLALLAAYNQVIPNIKGVINLYGITDIEQFWKEGRDGDILDTPNLLKSFLGSTPENASDNYHAANPLSYIYDGEQSMMQNFSLPATLTLHGKLDPLVKWAQAKRLDLQLDKTKTPHYNLIFDYATHGFEVNLNGPAGQPARYVIKNFLDSLSEAQ